MPPRKRRTTELERLGNDVEELAPVRRRTRSSAVDATPTAAAGHQASAGNATAQGRNHEAQIEHSKKGSKHQAGHWNGERRDSVPEIEDKVELVVSSLRPVLLNGPGSLSRAKTPWQHQLDTVCTELNELYQVAVRNQEVECFQASLARALWCLCLWVQHSRVEEQDISIASWPPPLNERWQSLNRLLIDHGWLTEATLVRWLPAETWLETGLVPTLNHRELWHRSLRRLHTRVHYTQPVVNAFREQPHGFASLLCALTTWIENADSSETLDPAMPVTATEEAFCRILDEHLSVFQLETNRVYDLGIQLLIAMHEWKLRQRRDAAQRKTTAAARIPSGTATRSAYSDLQHGNESATERSSYTADEYIESSLIAWIRRLPRRAVGQLLGFRLQQMQTASACLVYQRASSSSERLPEAVFLTAAHLIHEGIVSLEQLWPHLLNYPDGFRTSPAVRSATDSASGTPTDAPEQSTPEASSRIAPGSVQEILAAAQWDALAAEIHSQTKALLRVRLVDRDAAADRNVTVGLSSSTERNAATASGDADTARQAVDSFYELLGMHGPLAALAGPLALLAALVDYDEFELVQRWIQREWLADLEPHTAPWRGRCELIYAAAPLRYALFAYVLRHLKDANRDEYMAGVTARSDAPRTDQGERTAPGSSSSSLRALVQACRYLGGHMAQRPEQLRILCSVTASADNLSSIGQDMDEDAGIRCSGLVTDSLFPAVLFSQGSMAISPWILQHPDSPLHGCTYAQRYALYLHRSTQGSQSIREPRDSVLIPFWHALYRSIGKRLLRRLAGDTVAMIAKSMEPVFCSDPWSVFRIIMEQIQSYDNLVIPVVDMLVWPLVALEQDSGEHAAPLRAAMAFSFDVFFALAMEELAGPQAKRRPHLRRDGSGVAAWFLNTIEVIVQLSVRLAQQHAVSRASDSRPTKHPEQDKSYDALQRVLQDAWSALLLLACEQIIQGDHAFYALIQRALECMAGLAPWDDEMLSEAQLEALAKDPSALSGSLVQSDAWTLWARAACGEQGPGPAWLLLIAIDHSRQQLVAGVGQSDASLKALTTLLDALQATFLQLACFLGIEWGKRRQVTEGCSEPSVTPRTIDDELGELLSPDGFFHLYRIRNSLRTSMAANEVSETGLLDRRIHQILADAEASRAARLNKAAVDSFSELVSIEWLRLFWGNDQLPERAAPDWFGPRSAPQPNSDEQDERVQLVAEFLLERCFLPRIVSSPVAYCCVRSWIILLMQEPDIAPFNLLLLLTILFKTVFLLLQGMTRLECIRLARFVREMLRMTDRWRRQGPESWERQRRSNTAFHGRGGTPCHWSQFVLWHELMREKMLNVACDALETLPKSLAVRSVISNDTLAHSVEPTTPGATTDGLAASSPQSLSDASESTPQRLGNILRALNLMVEEFPSRTNVACERIEKALSGIIEREQHAEDDEQHTSILTLATSYLGRLRARRQRFESRRATLPTSSHPRPEPSPISSRLTGRMTSKPERQRGANTSPETAASSAEQRERRTFGRVAHSSTKPRHRDVQYRPDDRRASARERQQLPPSVAARSFSAGVHKAPGAFKAKELAKQQPPDSDRPRSAGFHVQRRGSGAPSIHGPEHESEQQRRVHPEPRYAVPAANAPATNQMNREHTAG